MSNNAVRRIGGALLAGTVALGLGACADAGASEDARKEISLGVIRAWSDTEVAAAVMEHKARELGYDVTWEDLREPPLLYAGVAPGDVEVYASAGIDRTHKEYFERYEDQLGALENLIVNEYEDGEEAQALAEWLEAYPDVFDDA